MKIIHDNIEYGIEEPFKRMKARSEQMQQERREFMATQPQIIRCRVHPDCERLIDERLTATATAVNGGELKAGYAQCPKCREEAEADWLQKCGVPEILSPATFENFVPDSEEDAGHVAVVKEFCQVKRGSLILLGEYGTGKSHLAVAACRSFGRVWFVSGNSLVFALRATYRDRLAFDPIERAQSAKLFILDDVGLSSGGRDELPLIHEILDHRHNERKPTIITSNLPYDGLASVLGERMMDRLRQSAFRVLTFTGASHRREARERYFDEE